MISCVFLRLLYLGLILYWGFILGGGVRGNLLSTFIEHFGSFDDQLSISGALDINFSFWGFDN